LKLLIQLLRFRSRLKDDLEILKLYGALGTDNSNYKALKSYIDKTIAKAYPPVDPSSKKVDKLSVFFVIINIPVFVWSVWMTTHDNSIWLWLIFAIVSALAVSMNVLNLLIDRRRNR
jgi:hypothetical protein